MLTMSMPESLKKINGDAIYETNSFKDGLYFINQFKQIYPGCRILALLDLDNTVVSYRHTLGTDHWFDFDFNKFMTQGLSATETKDIVLPTYLDVVRKIHLDDIYAVEENTPTFIREMQANGVDTLALTSRGSYLLDETISQLMRFQINFNQGMYANNEKKLPPSEEGLFTQGMILTGGQHKGKCLLTALADFGDLPEFIIMWDDKLSNLEKVRTSIVEYNAAKMELNTDFNPVQFVGIRYSRLDQLVNNVDPRVTELQKQYFQRILSDEHALAIARAEQKKVRQHFVGIDYQPQKNSVILSINKNETYEKLLSLCSDLSRHQIVGAVKEICGKKKLAWQFQFTTLEFESLFHLLSQHGLIESKQFDELAPVFNPRTPVLTIMLQQHLQSTRNEDDILVSQTTNMSLDGKRKGAHL